MSQQDMKWYVVQAYSGCEDQVRRSLLERIQLNDAQAKFGQILVPKEEIMEMRAGQKRKSERKFFPGYILVQMQMDESTWHIVRNAPRVLGFVGGNASQPMPISDAEAHDILRRIEDGIEQPRPKFVYEPGEVVRVSDGVFKDFNGVVEEVDYEKSRLKVAVLIFGRSTPVELGFDQVEKE